MKKLFITGIVTLLPLALTLIIVDFFIDLLTEPFIGFFQGIIVRYLHVSKIFLLKNNLLQKFIIQIFILALFFVFTVFLGMIARWFFVNTFIKFSERIFEHIPVVRSIYTTLKEVTQTIFSTKTKSFKQVVLVPFPNMTTQAIGLITKDAIHIEDDVQQKEFAMVFVPTTPNPTSGFLLILPAEDLTYLDVPIEEAFKYIISCGIIATPMNKTMFKEKEIE